MNLPFLKPRQNGSAAGVPPAPQSSMPERRFFEVFGDTIMENQFLRNLTIVLAGACLILTFALQRAINKPTLVIRVDNASEPAVIRNAAQEAAVTAPEVRNFTEHFTRNLLAWDLYSLDEDIDRALAMMTPDAAVKMKNRLDGLNVTAKVKENSLRTKVLITEISVEKDSRKAIAVKVRGSRLAESYLKTDYRKETVFEDFLVLSKVQRSLETPWGLLVEDWRESIFKETP